MGPTSARFPYGFAGHDVIPGVGADDPIAPRNPALADDIGRVLARLHAIPADVATGLGVGTAVEKTDLAAGLARVRYVVEKIPEIRNNCADACAWLDNIRSAPPRARRSDGRL